MTFTDKIHIRATIMAERQPKKGLTVLKTRFHMLKKLVPFARKDIEVMPGDKVFLKPGYVGSTGDKIDLSIFHK